MWLREPAGAALPDTQLALCEGKQTELRQGCLHDLDPALNQQHIAHLQHQLAEPVTSLLPLLDMPRRLTPNAGCM